jgi:hypothetical protein
MAINPERGAAPGWEPEAGPDTTNPYDKARPKGTAAELEAVVFLDGARRWIDHGLAGDIALVEAAVAAQLLCARAERLAA